jgi:hypothetical protein
LFVNNTFLERVNFIYIVYKSSTELSCRYVYSAGPGGIEPPPTRLECVVLPLNYGPCRASVAKKMLRYQHPLNSPHPRCYRFFFLYFKRTSLLDFAGVVNMWTAAELDGECVVELGVF